VASLPAAAPLQRLTRGCENYRGASARESKFFLALHPVVPRVFQWVGRRSNPRLLVFSQALYRLSYRPMFCESTNEKGPASL
jgi:hypothetical protein